MPFRFYLSLQLLACAIHPEFVIAADKPAGRLIFLGVAYDEAPPRGFDANHYNYAPDNFTRLLEGQSKDLFGEFKHDELKGNRATHANVIAGIKNTRKLLKPDDLVIFYWGTHGATSRKGWGANLPGNGIIHGSEIKTELATFPCPTLMLISTCGSGGFARDKADGVPVPPNVLVMTACQRKQSTSNELDRSVLEALAGFGDEDDDGQVTLQEVRDYVPKRYAKWFPPNDDDAESDLAPVIVKGNAIDLARPVTKVSESHVAVVQDGVWYGATVLEETPKGRKVRFLAADAFHPKGGFYHADAVVEDEYLDLPGGFPPVEVEWEGSWYPARILKKDGMQFSIHYIGYGADYDETVPRKRIRFPFCQPVVREKRNRK